MKSIQSFVRPDLLLEAARELAYWLDGSGAEMAVGANGGLPSEVLKWPAMTQALAEISGLTGLEPIHVMVNKLAPGVSVSEHRDFLLPTKLQNRNHPTIERWHLPLITSLGSKWWDERNGFCYFPPGYWTGPVPYWLKHSVKNLGNVERIHLVVDCDTSEHIGEYRD